jgi:carbon-monoxide dehydrogenase medium subunit
MQDFKAHRPKTVAEAVAAVGKTAEGKFLAGGQSLIPMMKLDLAAPSDLVLLSGIPELKKIETTSGALVIGAGATHAEVSASSAVKKAIPVLADLAGGIGDPQVRNRGTLGGSIAHGDPAADYPAAVLGLGATIKTSEREIAADDYFKGMFETALKGGELITSVSFRVPDKAAYVKFGNPASKYAIVGVMVAKKGGDVRVAVTGAGTRAFRAEALERALSARFSPDALDNVEVPTDDFLSDSSASAEYRGHLVTVMAKRAVAACQ